VAKKGRKKLHVPVYGYKNPKVERFAVCCVRETRRQTEISNQIKGKNSVEVPLARTKKKNNQKR